MGAEAGFNGLIRNGEGVPAHVRNRYFGAGGVDGGEGFDEARNEAEAVAAAIFGGSVKEELHAEADAKEGPAGANVLTDWLGEAGGAEGVHRGAEGPNTREDKRVRAIDLPCGARSSGIAPKSGERIANRSNVSGAILDQRHSRLPPSSAARNCARHGPQNVSR